MAELFPKDQRPYFNSELVGDTKNHFVAWVDLMGAKASMGRSLYQTANFIGKIHTAAFDSIREGVRAYPVIDGCYITATISERERFEGVLRAIMLRLANAFVTEPKYSQRFLVRSGIAAGRIMPGSELVKGSNSLRNREGYSKSVALGTAIGQAYMAERLAPPFGFYVDITARSFVAGRLQPFTSVYWRWWDDGKADDVRRRDIIREQLDCYYHWITNNYRALEYPVDAFKDHHGRASEYFRRSTAP